MRCSSGARAEPGPRVPPGGLGAGLDGQPTAFPADPPPDLPPGPADLLPAPAPPGRPATMTYFIAIAGRRWPVEETFKTGKDVLGWDQCQARTWDAVAGHRLVRVAQLRQGAIRNALCGLIDLPPATAAAATGTNHAGTDLDDADLRIPLGDAPVPAYPGQPRPRQLGLIRLSVAETARSPAWPLTGQEGSLP